MNFQTMLDSVLVLVVLLDLGMLAVSRLGTCIRLFALQSLLLALLPPAIESGHGDLPGIHGVIIAVGTLVLKVFLIPWILFRILRTGEIQREIEPLFGFTASVLVGAMLVVGSFAITRHFPRPVDSISDLLLPVSAGTILVGLLILISRVKAVTQVVGYLVVENGIYLFGLMLLKQTPLLVELGILLDLFVAVFIMAIVVYQIRREFDHMDTHLLDNLKET